MSLVNLATDHVAAGAGSTVQLTVTPALPYRQGVICIDVSANYDRTIKVEGSVDGTVWTDVAGATIAGADQTPLKLEAVLQPYMRVNQTDDGSAGTASVNILA